MALYFLIPHFITQYCLFLCKSICINLTNSIFVTLYSLGLGFVLENDIIFGYDVRYYVLLIFALQGVRHIYYASMYYYTRLIILKSTKSMLSVLSIPCTSRILSLSNMHVYERDY